MRSTLDRMWQEIEETGHPAGYVVEIIDGKVIMTPQSPVQSWTVRNVDRQVEAAGIDPRRLVTDVAVDFPGETSAAPDLAILDEAAVPIGRRFSCLDVLAAVEVVSSESDANDYVTKVAKYARFGIATYLIIDPFRGVCTLHEKAEAEGYTKVAEYAYGETVPVRVQDGLTVELDTSSLLRED
jgi:Uma2 family endonuclease